VVAAATRRLIGNLFRLQALGRHQIKGLSEPVEAWAVKGVVIAALLSIPCEERHGAVAMTSQKFKDETLRALAESSGWGPTHRQCRPAAGMIDPATEILPARRPRPWR